jgi:hypothetical protein
LQLARLALIVAAPSRWSGPRGQFARRRRRGTECLRAASGAQARYVSPGGPLGDRRELRRVRVSVILARRSPRERLPAGRRAPRALEDVEKVLTASGLTGLRGCIDNGLHGWTPRSCSPRRRIAPDPLGVRAADQRRQAELHRPADGPDGARMGLGPACDQPRHTWKGGHLFELEATTSLLPALMF